MKRLYTRLLAVTLIISISFIQVHPAFAENEIVEPTPTVAPTPTPTVEPTPSPEPQPLSSVSEESSEVSPTESSVESTATSTPSAVTIDTDSTATTSSIVDVSASTGANTIAGTGTTTIVTGDSVANADVVTTANVTSVNSNTAIVIANQQGQSDTHADLRDIFATGSSTMLTSTSTAISTTATNTAHISNTVIVRSDTGDNHATGSDALISTGDAVATANIINLLNTNIIDSNLLLLIFNSFGDWAGDIVLPNADFFEQYFQSYLASSNSTAPLLVAHSNDSSVTNITNTSATTGENTSHGDSTLILTGDSNTGVNIINDINQNYSGGAHASLIFRVFGNWSGTVFNLPSTFTSHNTPFGIQFVSVGSSSPATQLGPISATLSNSATINNNITVEANTGDNTAHGSTTTILTGDAYAAANIVNIANTNIIGRNWMNAIINIFGDWSGNVSFGQPDLWVGTRAEFKNGNNWPGSEITYYYTVKNNGDAPAHDVALHHLVGAETSHIGLPELFEQNFEIGTLAPGEQKEISHNGSVLHSVHQTHTEVINTIRVTAHESDSKISDNTDIISVIVTNSLPAHYGPKAVPERFAITKTNNSSGTVSASSTVDYTITVRNVGGYAQTAQVTDIITNESGQTIHTEAFDLGEVFADEEITIRYSVFFSASTTPGKYTNIAKIVSPHDSVTATSDVVITDFTPLVALRSEVVETLPVKTLQIYRQSQKLATTATIITEATSTNSVPSTIVKSFTEFKPVHDSNNFLASVISTLNFSGWYWLLLAIIFAIYLTHRYKKTYQY
jgi:hypothetical protein